MGGAALWTGVSGMEKSEDKERSEGKQQGALGGQQKTRAGRAALLPLSVPAQK